ncbi:MAG TPA: hypothetical protein VII63_07030 [Caulobacteraceae bacterium]
MTSSIETFGGALMDGLPKLGIIAAYAAAPGGELARLASPRSSAALVANAFGFFLEAPRRLALPRPALAPGGARSVALEVEMRLPWTRGRHPWLDVAIETADLLIGIEAKRFEPFDARQPPQFSKAYDRNVWGSAMGPYQAMRDQLRAGRPFRRLDACQLVKHAFGLSHEAHRRDLKPVLLYLYAEPAAFPGGPPIAAEEHARHRAELAGFAADVNDPAREVAFESLTWRELLAHWAIDPGLAAHAGAIAERFDV